MLSLVYIVLLPLAAQSAVDMQAGTVQLEIKTTWDSDPVESPTLVTLSKDSAGLGVHVEAKFWNDPPKQIMTIRPAGFEALRSCFQSEAGPQMV